MKKYFKKFDSFFKKTDNDYSYILCIPQLEEKKYDMRIIEFNQGSINVSKLNNVADVEYLFSDINYFFSNGGTFNLKKSHDKEELILTLGNTQYKINLWNGKTKINKDTKYIEKKSEYPIELNDFKQNKSGSQHIESESTYLSDFNMGLKTRTQSDPDRKSIYFLIKLNLKTTKKF